MLLEGNYVSVNFPLGKKFFIANRVCLKDYNLFNNDVKICSKKYFDVRKVC